LLKIKNIENKISIPTSSTNKSIYWNNANIKINNIKISINDLFIDFKFNGINITGKEIINPFINEYIKESKIYSESFKWELKNPKIIKGLIYAEIGEINVKYFIFEKKLKVRFKIKDELLKKYNFLINTMLKKDKKGYYIEKSL
jgi:hypothetical protein